MSLRFAPGTKDYLGTLAPGPRRAIRDCLRLIALDARHGGLDLKLLRTSGVVRVFRARVGDYRVIYTPRPGHTYVWRIQHRSEGYGWLDRLDPWPRS